MVEPLDQFNVVEHLIERGLCSPVDRPLSVEIFSCKNLNLLVTLAAEQKELPKTRYLVKQSPSQEGKVSSASFQLEWDLYQQIRCRQELTGLLPIFPDAADYDSGRGILVFRFLDQYLDLGKYYSKSSQLTPRLAVALGATLASVHQASFGVADRFVPVDLAHANATREANAAPDLCGEMEQLTPDIFRHVPREGLKFYVFYQRAPEISDAVLELENSYKACCLTHHDLKLANVLVHQQWSDWVLPSLPVLPGKLLLSSGEAVVRLIDWEQWRWGDPAFDLGTLVAEYLRLWLKSIPISKDLDPKSALQLAALPLQMLQPSMRSLLEAYLCQFPSIWDLLPDFPERVLRFAGLALLNAIQDRLHYKQSFGNLEIAMMQVGRNLLCHPVISMPTVFGCEEINAIKSCEQLPRHWGAFPSLPARVHSTPMPSTSGEHVESLTIPSSLWPPKGTWEGLLDEICAHVQIEQKQQIRHPAYAPLSLVHPAWCLDRDQESGSQESRPTSEAEELYRLRQTRNYLHAIYFSGELNQHDHPPLHGAAFTRRLEAANSGVGYADTGWVVMAEEEGVLLVAKEGLHLWINPGRDLAHSAHTFSSGCSALGASTWVGASVALVLPNSTWILNHYMAIGNAGEPEASGRNVDLFFNISAQGAILLMERCIPMLNERGFPFTLKVLPEPHLYGRLDSAILRLPAAVYGDIHPFLVVCYSELQPHLSSPVPLFTCPLAAGIGLAEVPENGADFGLERCELLAEAILSSAKDAQRRREAIQRLFEQRALDWQRPHLNAASEGRYPPLRLKCSPSMPVD